MSIICTVLFRGLRGSGLTCVPSVLGRVCRSERSPVIVRNISCNSARLKASDFQRIAKNTPESKKTTLYYLGALGVLIVGGSYCAVPLYRIFCQVSLAFRYI